MSKPKSHKTSSESKSGATIKHSHSTSDLAAIKKLQAKSDELTLTQLSSIVQIGNVKDFLRADIPLTTNSFRLCPHKHHCAQNAIFKGLFRTFAATYIFKTSIVVASQLFNGKIFKKVNGRTLLSLDWSKIESIYYSRDSIQFAQFVALMSFTYKAIVCSLRRLRHKDSIYHKTIAGFLSALWVIRDTKQRRKTLALYCTVRALGDWIKLIQYNSKKKNDLCKDKTVTDNTQNTINSSNIKSDKTIYDKLFGGVINGEVVTFTIAQLLIMFSFAHAPFAMDQSYYKWIKNMGNLKEYQIQQVYRSRIDPTKMYKLANDKYFEPFVKCNPIFHKHASCLKSNLIDLIECFLFRSFRMYVYVHFLPIILFTPKKFFNRPLYYIQLKLLNTMRSAIFLAFYVFNMKHTQCIFRNYLKSDPWWVATLGGFFSGLSVIIEHPKRRTELCLYVIPRAIEILFRLLTRKFHFSKKILKSLWLPAISFACAISAWMTLIATENGKVSANGLNMTVLQVIFGTNH